MSHTGRRISRSLMAALLITLIVGVAFHLKNMPTSTPAAPAKAEIAIAPSIQPTTAPTPPLLSAMKSEPLAIEVKPPSTQPMLTPTTMPMWSTDRSINISPTQLADAQSKKDAGDLLAARKMLNDALLSGKLSPAEIEATKKSIADINQTVIFSSRHFTGDEFGGNYMVQSGDRMTKIADKHDVTWELLCRINNLSDPKKLRAGVPLKIINGPFSAVVTKSKFNMDIYLGPPGEKGAMYVMSVPVGLGKDDSTPTGTWTVETGKKVKNPTYFSPRGEGVIDKDDPKNPLGERWIGLTGIDGKAVGQASYGIHGTIDESSIGQQSSMGCIRLHNADVELVYDLLVEGKSTVIVRD
jgi:LysM repeat protein